MSFKDISIFSSGGTFVGRAEPFVLFKIFGRKHYGEHSYEIILNLDQ